MCSRQSGQDTAWLMQEAWVQVKGNVYKNKRVLTEAIHRQKAEKLREKNIADQFEARRSKNKQSRERKLARREERLTMVRAHLPQDRVMQPSFVDTTVVLWIGSEDDGRSEITWTSQAGAYAAVASIKGCTSLALPSQSRRRLVVHSVVGCT